MVNVLGLDIGGANTKATFLKTHHHAVKELRTLLEYFPFWKRKDQFTKLLNDLKKDLVSPSVMLDAIGVTITAELSDAYSTKREGIQHVLDCVGKVFDGIPIFVLNVEINMISVEEALKKPFNVSSANWAATGWMVKQIISNCIIIDVGSTTTSIIPIVNGSVAVRGRTDLEKLQNGELVYTGSLRTNIATIVDRIPIKGQMTRISSEFFSQSGDVHLILGNIKENEYTVETCDGRGKTDAEAASRLAKVVCADTEMLTRQEILDMAKFVYEKQLEQIAGGLRQVYERIDSKPKTIVVTGIGRNFLAKRAAEKLGFESVVDLVTFLGINALVMSPSVGVALMTAEQLEGKSINWKRS